MTPIIHGLTHTCCCAAGAYSSSKRSCRGLVRPALLSLGPHQVALMLHLALLVPQVISRHHFQGSDRRLSRQVALGASHPTQGTLARSLGAQHTWVLQDGRQHMGLIQDSRHTLG